jgi:sulfate/thiosulfate transport system substrate-binding protein
MRFAVLAGTVLVLAAAAAAAALTSSDATARSEGGTLRLVAYSTPREAYAKLIEDFRDNTTAGRDTSFEQSYGSSGEQARAVIAGLKADVVAFSLEPDMSSLVKAKLVTPSWKENRYRGMVTRSVVVFAVRKGNPKKIRTWADLVKPDVDVVTPNVQTSGGAKWNVMAAYGAQRKIGLSHARSVKYLEKLYDHVVSQDKSAREALQTVMAGRGDVLLAYENEAIFAQKKNQPIDYVIPKSTITIENPIAVTKTSGNKTTANAFLRFLRTKPAQLVFGENGYRPVLPSAAKTFGFPVPKLQFTIKYLGGWAKVNKQFFDPRNGIVTKIQRRKGG